MRRLAVLPLFLLSFLVSQAALATGPWSGEWVTDFGLLELTQKGNEIHGSYGPGRSLKGTVRGKTLTFTYRDGEVTGKGTLELSRRGESFGGKWQSGRARGTWRGWRKDPKAEEARPAKFEGVWLSSLGTMVLTQKGERVSGTYGSEGWSTIEGELRGRRLHFTWKRLQASGPAWIEMTKDGKRFFGMTAEEPPVKWLGLRLEGFKRNVKPKPGKIVAGLSANQMNYFLRAPRRWTRRKKTDAVVLLHGSNWTTKGMVGVTAKNWPELGAQFMIIGIQGQNWADWSDLDDLRHNYTYVNWMGKSTYKGYPNTHRESPALVAEVIEELKTRHNLGRIFLGGHSQGGYLALIMYMHFPEMLAGVFPMACGLVIQAEPDAFDDEELMAAQRATPLAIVHGKLDGVVPCSTGEYNYDRFEASGFPMLRFFSREVGHGYDFQPVGEAVGWLAALSTSNVDELLKSAKQSARKSQWRDLAALLLRAMERKADTKLKKLASQLDAAAEKEADLHLQRIRKDEDGTWVDSFLPWRQQFEFAPAAKRVMAAFYELREKHDPAAEKLIEEARKRFRSGDRDGGYAKYQEIVDTYYASRRYKIVKRWLAERQ